MESVNINTICQIQLIKTMTNRPIHQIQSIDPVNQIHPINQINRIHPIHVQISKITH